MTRNEAVQKLQVTHGFVGAAPWAEQWIDTWVALGMLKLEEPKSALDKFEELAAKRFDWLPGTDSASILHDVRELLRDAGLKIVSK